MVVVDEAEDGGGQLTRTCEFDLFRQTPVSPVLTWRWQTQSKRYTFEKNSHTLLNPSRGEKVHRRPPAVKSLDPDCIATRDELLRIFIVNFDNDV